ncbi:MAG: ATPase [Pseudomonadota bacterium]
MIYEDAEDWLKAKRKRVALIGMSGVGKTRISALLRDEGDWFHYSVDYRIGTRYLNEHIVDDFRREAMKNAYLRELLRSDSISIQSKLSFQNLTPLSTWLGKPGASDKGGIPFEEYLRRQRLHRDAEIKSMLNAPDFIDRASDVFDYAHFVCDTSGSICEVVEAENQDDPVLNSMYQAMLPVYIRGTEAHEDALKARFDRAPKPMYYQEAFLTNTWEEYLKAEGVKPEKVDPDAFIRYGFAQLLNHRRPRYQAIADRWGVAIEADDIAAVVTGDDFEALVAAALDTRAAS